MSICTKLAELITGLETPVELKLKLIPIFQHMHHDGNTSVKVKENVGSCCKKLVCDSFKHEKLITFLLTILLIIFCRQGSCALKCWIPILQRTLF